MHVYNKVINWCACIEEKMARIHEREPVLEVVVEEQTRFPARIFAGFTKVIVRFRSAAYTQLGFIRVLL